MNKEKLVSLIQLGEGLEVEFKTSHTELSRDAFETIVAFLNKIGGHLILGIKDNGELEGVRNDRIEHIVNHIITSANNPDKLNPTYYLSPEVVDYDVEKIIYIRVPQSSQVHSTAGKIFVRNHEGDMNITRQPDQLTQLYQTKQNSFNENDLYPSLKITDFRADLFDRVRFLSRSQKPDHPWLGMSNEELLRSAGLYMKDFKTGNEGYTLAAALIFGKDEVIHNILPSYKTDAIRRVADTDRYDDREEIRTNLIESYEKLMSFVIKHLPDKFHLDGNQRISIRDHLFREVLANTLIHREYLNPFPAKFIIQRRRVFIENWNRPHGSGNIDPDTFSPYPKNPTIAKFFKEIGRAEELGSGIRNTYKYCQMYSPGAVPEFTEGDIFTTIIPIEPYDQVTSTVLDEFLDERLTEVISEGVSEGVIEGVTEGVKQELVKILETIIRAPGIKTDDISKNIGRPKSTTERYIKILRRLEVIYFRGAPKAGGYFLSESFDMNLPK